MSDTRAVRIGLVSDTHGVLRPEALDYLRGSEAIIHAGDIGNMDVIDQLRALAPVHAVRGNNDGGEWARGIPDREVVSIAGLLIYVLHDRNELELDPAVAGFHAVVCGHSHRPTIDERDGVLYVNPGSAGPRRFSLPVSAGELYIADGRLMPRLATLIDDAPRR